MISSNLPTAASTGLERLLRRYATDLGAKSAFLYLATDGEMHSALSSTPSDSPIVAALCTDLAQRVLDRAGMVMVDDLLRDPLLAAEPSALTGAVLAMPVFGEARQTLGAVVAYHPTARAWSNTDLERADDVAQTVSAVLVVDQLHRHAEIRLAIETRARVTRQRMHSIARQSASAASVGEVAKILAEETPALLGASWALVAWRQSDDVDWLFWGSEGLQTGPLREACLQLGSSGRSFLDVIAEQPENLSTHIRTDLRAWPELSAVISGTGASSLATRPLAHGTDQTHALLLIGFSDQVRGVRAELIFDELLTDAKGALVRVAAAQLQSMTAETLQRSLLPPRVPTIDGFEIGQLYNSATDHARVGGDWYDVVQISPTRTAFVVGDVAGHDVRSAAVMGQLRHVLASRLSDDESPAASLAATDRYFADRDESVMATAVVIVADTATGMARVALAGHPPPVIIGARGAELLAVEPGPPLGFGYGGYVDSALELPIGTFLLAYTDGVVERRSGDLQQHLREFVDSLAAVPRTVADLVDFVNARSKISELVDDVAALVVQYVGA